jgi:Sulfotransferase domain
MPETPNLFIVGAPKCGTTFLAKHLAKRAEVVFSQPKEPFFFQGDRYKDPAAVAEYLSERFRERHVPEKSKARYMADGSTTYFYRKESLEAILNQCGTDIRVIFAIRQPVERFVSHLLHDYRRRPEKMPTIEERWDYWATRSRYAKAARMWIDRLGFSRVLPLRFDDLERSPYDFLNIAARFLDIQPFRKVPEEKVNAGTPFVLSDGRIELPDDPNFPTLLLDDLRRLQEDLMDDIHHTQAITGLDLRGWHEPQFIAEIGARDAGQRETMQPG